MQKLQEQLGQQGEQLQQQQEQQRAVLAAHEHSCEELQEQLAAAEQVPSGLAWDMSAARLMSSCRILRLGMWVLLSQARLAVPVSSEYAMFSIITRAAKHRGKS